MSEIFKFKRRVEEHYDGEKMKIEKMGARSFKITTGNSGEFDFRNRIKAERFDREFIDQLNKFLSSEEQLDQNDREVYQSLSILRKKLEEDTDHFEFKVSFRMVH